MKSPALYLFVLLVVLAGASRSPVTAQQMKRAEALTIGVTVDPTCTVAVVSGETQPDNAIDLVCRNFREGQPQPILLEAAPRDGHEVVLVRF
jgi:hypothetical protein